MGKLNLHYKEKCETELRKKFFLILKVKACNMSMLIASKIP